MTRIPALILLLAAAEGSLAARTVSRCGVSAVVPASWSVTSAKTDASGTCSFSLKPADWEHLRRTDDLEVGAFALEVAVRPGSLAQNFASGTLWRDEAGRLHACSSGPAGCGEAHEVRTKCCIGVLGESGTTRFYKDGSRGGMDSFLIGFLAAKGRVATIRADAAFRDTEIFEKLLKSIVLR